MSVLGRPICRATVTSSSLSNSGASACREAISEGLGGLRLSNGSTSRRGGESQRSGGLQHKKGYRSSFNEDEDDGLIYDSVME